MNEHEFRDALRGVMTATPTPRSMNGNVVLEAARRAHRRRRATLAGLACAGAVVLIAAVAIVLPGLNRGNTSVIGIGGPGTVQQPATDTKTSWPDGQTDRTATQGPRADKGVQLMNLLSAAVPGTLRAPEDLQPGSGATRHGALRSHQAQYAFDNGDKQVWEYMAEVPIGASEYGTNRKYGHLLAEVHTAGNKLSGDGCELTAKFWGMGGECQLISVGDKQIGVAIRPTGDDRFDQWAGYRHPDGTVVFIAQGKTYDNTGLPGLAELPLTPQQLAALAAAPSFHLD